MATKNRVAGMMGDTLKLRTVPGIFSVIFFVSGAYLFGAISQISFNWFGGFTLTTQYAFFASLVAYLAVFLSSSSNSLEYYDDWEAALVVGGPLVIIAHRYIPEFSNFLTSTFGDPLGMQVAMLLTIVGWGVTVR